MIRRLIPLIIVLLCTLLLTLVVQDFVRDVVVVPVVYVAWIAWLALINLPHWFFWALLVLFSAVLAMRSLRGTPTHQEDAVQKAATAQGPVTLWAQRLHDASTRQSSRWRIARDLGHIFWETRFPEEPFNMQAFIARIDQPELAVPPAIRDYFQAGLSRPEPAYRTWFFLLRNRPATSLDLDPAVVVTFLEETHTLVQE